MSTPVPLPALGESVTEGTVSRWLKQVGDQVAADEALVEISTDKVDTEVPSPVAGVLLEIVVPEDGVAEVGATLAIIGDAAETPTDAPATPAAPSMPTAPAMPPAPAMPTPPTMPAAPSGAAPAAPAMPTAPTLPTSPAVASMPAAPVAPAAAPAAPAAPAQPVASSGATTEIVLPQLGESVTEGTISRWLKQVGETVTADEALVEVSTDKVDTEIPAPASGVLVEIRVAEDSVAAVGSVLGVIGAEAAAPAPATPEAPAPVAAPAAPTPAAPTPTQAAPVQAAPVQPQAATPSAPTAVAAPAVAAAPAAPAAAAPRAGESNDVYVTPLVRKMAEANGVDLSTVTGTGVGGRIRKQDVLAAAEAKKAAAPQVATAAPAASATAAIPPSPDAGKRGTTEKMSRLRATIAARMVDSLAVSAQLTATVEVDLTNIAKLRAKVKDGFRAREGVGLTFLAFIAKAVTEALKHYPRVNATIDTAAGTISYAEAEHLGIAVDTERGLLVPVIAHAGNLNVTGMANKIADLASRTRAGKVSPDELSGGTFTITNYGSAGTLFDTPIINQPQVAILGTGAVVRRPMVITDPKQGEMIAIRDMMYLSLTYDHRLVDGAEAARFLSMLKTRLEEGDFGSELGL